MGGTRPARPAKRQREENAQHPPKRPSVDFTSIITVNVTLANAALEVESEKLSVHIYKDVIWARSARIRRLSKAQSGSFSTDLWCPTINAEVLQFYLDWIHAEFYGPETNLDESIAMQINRTPAPWCKFGQQGCNERYSSVSFLCMLWIQGATFDDTSVMNRVMDCLLSHNLKSVQNVLRVPGGFDLMACIVNQLQPDDALHRWAMDVLMSTLKDADIEDIFETAGATDTVQQLVSTAIVQKLLAERKNANAPSIQDTEKYRTREKGS